MELPKGFVELSSVEKPKKELLVEPPIELCETPEQPDFHGGIYSLFGSEPTPTEDSLVRLLPGRSPYSFSDAFHRFDPLLSRDQAPEADPKVPAGVAFPAVDRENAQQRPSGHHAAQCLGSERCAGTRHRGRRSANW